MSEQTDKKMEEARDLCSISVPADQQGQCLLRRLWNSPTWSSRAPSPKAYPSISSIPKTSPERLSPTSIDSAKTVLYLAYGSNMCAETFLGRRGIRPISQINVSAPALDLTFDLPGIPYNEPCFANTRPRKIPQPPIPIPGRPPNFPPPPAYHSSSALPISPPQTLFPSLPDQGPTWSKGLYGVVYEVTPEDYATIIKTEGGGNGYHDVLTPCIELPPALHVPEKPPVPSLPKPFLAHTLYAPSLPDLPGGGDDDGDDDKSKDEEEDSKNSDDGDDDDDDDKDPRKQHWFRRLLLPTHRPQPGYAQASARYLKLIRDGAREHALPDEYQAYLARLQPYTITSVWQQVGRVLFVLLMLPFVLPMLVLSRLIADENGRTPRWLGIATTVCFNICWAAYDVFFKSVFGDGERTVPEDEDQGATGRRSGRTMMPDGVASEKNRLLSDW
jgi:hypothetical protein